MAIYKFTQEPSEDITNFALWLNEHQEECFLDGYGLTRCNVDYGTHQGLKISADSNNYIIFYFSKSGDDWQAPIFTYHVGSVEYDSVKWTSSDYILLESALLTKNGLMINIKGQNSDLGLSGVTQCEYALTKCSNGLVLLNGFMGRGESHFNPPTSGYSYNVISPYALTENKCIKPQYDMPYTTIAREITGDGVVCEHLYSATNTQLSNNVATELVSMGQHYISNGRWYIDDLD